jgi:hypothetical protein
MKLDGETAHVSEYEDRDPMEASVVSSGDVRIFGAPLAVEQASV